tara:strand:+ start:395 stop:1126 length:732 start_codon:yes stop_codon:yes gene_type:complete
MIKKVVIIIGGGSRGLGKSLLDNFEKKGFERVAFHRSADIKNTKNYYFDIDQLNAIKNTKDDLISFLNSTNYKEYIIHFISGGSLGIDFSDSSEKSFQRVLKHNLIVPSIFTSAIFNNFNLTENKKINLFYYSSAVVKNIGSSAYYVAAKSALENMFKASFLKKPSGVNMHLLRLGFVDIEYKYYHKIYLEDKAQFKKLVLDNLPSKHFPKPIEIAEFALNISESSNIMNGMISDLTGGHSWK